MFGKNKKTTYENSPPTERNDELYNKIDTAIHDAEIEVKETTEEVNEPKFEKEEKRMKVMLLEPEVFDKEAMLKEMKAGETIAVVSFAKMERKDAENAYNFLDGVMAALEGNVRYVGANTIVCAPMSLDVEDRINFNVNEANAKKAADMAATAVASSKH